VQGQGPYCEAGVVEAFHPLGPPDTHRVQDLAAACDGAHGQAWGWSMAKLRRIGRTVPERLEDPAASTVAGILRARVARAAVVLIAAAPFLHFLEMCEERRELARLRRGRGRECGGDGGGGGRASAGAWSAHSEVALAFTRRGDRIQAAVVRYRSPRGRGSQAQRGWCGSRALFCLLAGKRSSLANSPTRPACFSRHA